MSKQVSVIIPTYNERDNIGPLVERMQDALSGYAYEVVFVDDDSKDGTVELITSLSDRYPVRVIVRRDKRGLASAVVDGLAQMDGQVAVVMDADLQHPPEIIPSLLKAIDDGSDVAVASRYTTGGGMRGWSLTRKVISKGATFLAHLLLPSTRQVKDPMSGFFSLRRQVVDSASLSPKGYKILLEILVEGQFNRAVKLPFTFETRSRGESKLSAKQQVDYLKHLYSLLRRKGEIWRFVKFCLVGLSGVGVNMGLLWLLTEVAGLFYLISAAISIETSIITNFVLNNFFTFPDRNLPGAGQFFGRLLKFNLVSLAGLGINLGVLSLLTEVFGMYYLVGNICGIAVAILWNYLANSWWTWR